MSAYALEIGSVLLGVAFGMIAFGFVPTVAAKFISLAFRKSDPRRQELVAEVRGVPRWERPIWVGEQIGRIFTEAIPDRAAARFKPSMRMQTSLGGRLDLTELFGEPAELNLLGAEPGGRMLGIIAARGHEELFAIPLRRPQETITIAVSRKRRNRVIMHVGDSYAVFTSFPRPARRKRRLQTIEAR
ncbi:hypothetical protein AB0N73_00745 [Microbacterium sp. NPDC089189]|uniref:hypothetical protein n=1 Tax=Microbacterium sp. NPDC089189 TaxID=3154972 RepID=UPI00342195A3